MKIMLLGKRCFDETDETLVGGLEQFLFSISCMEYLSQLTDIFQDC